MSFKSFFLQLKFQEILLGGVIYVEKTHICLKTNITLDISTYHGDLVSAFCSFQRILKMHLEFVQK